MALAKSKARPARKHTTAGNSKAPASLDTWLARQERLLGERKFRQVERECRKRLRQDQTQPVAWATLGMALCRDGKRKEGLDAFAKFYAHGGIRYPSLLRAYFLALRDNKEDDKALELIEQALERYPNDAELYANFGYSLSEKDRGRAKEALETACRLGSDATYWIGLGNVYFDLGEHHKAHEAFRRAIELDPKNYVAYANLLMTNHYLPEQTKEGLFALHKEWYTHFFRDLVPTSGFQRNLDPNRPLRLGLISGGFHAHPVGWMSFGALKALKKVFQCELYFYYTSSEDKSDFIKKELHELADGWHDVKSWSHDQLYRQMLRDNLDILLEMAGHSMNNRLPVVARRVAPVQVKWVGGLFNTTGVESIDYLISDRIETPEGEDPYYFENLVRLPTGYVAYNPPPYAPDVGALPMRENGFVTFGCFNNIYKVNARIVEVWARLLQRVPDSRLMFKYKGMEDPAVQRWITDLFESNGIGAERLIFEPRSLHHELLDTYNKIDIALDPWPYSGGLTTVEALYMGVPVITCPGPVFAGRHAASHLTNVGLSDWVVEDFDAYVDKASEWAGRPDDLADLRRGLRRQVEASPLCNRLQFATDLMFALLIMWQKWVQGQPPAPIDIGAVRNGEAGGNADTHQQAPEAQTAGPSEAAATSDDTKIAPPAPKEAARTNGASAPVDPVEPAGLAEDDLTLLDLEQLRLVANRLTGSKLFPATAITEQDLALLADDPVLNVLSNYQWTAFSMEPSSIAYLKKIIATFKPRTVLELGSGISTPILARHHATIVDDPTARYVSVDQDASHIAQTKSNVARAGMMDHVHLVRLDLVDVDCFGQKTKCYELDAVDLLEALNDSPIDLLIVDGPSAGGKTGVPFARLPTLPWLQDRLAPNALVCLDDALRETEQIAGVCWQHLPGIELLGVRAVGKGLLVLQNAGEGLRWRDAAKAA